SELKQQREQEGAIVPASKRALANGGSPVAAYLAAPWRGNERNVFQVRERRQVPQDQRRRGNPGGDAVRRDLRPNPGRLDQVHGQGNPARAEAGQRDTVPRTPHTCSQGSERPGWPRSAKLP